LPLEDAVEAVRMLAMLGRAVELAKWSPEVAAYLQSQANRKATEGYF
jgi:hypothetical protein